jgi:hypothetical protein
MGRIRLVLALSLLPLVVPLASARANTYCVSDPSCVTAGGTSEGSDLAAAFTAAQSNGGADKVQIGAGTFTAPDAAGFIYNSPDPVAVVGAGQSATTLAGAAAVDNGVVLTVVGSAGSSISNLAIALPPSQQFSQGLQTRAAVSDVSITAPGSALSPFAVRLAGAGSLTRTTIDLPRGDANGGTGVEPCGPAANPTACPGGTGEFITDSSIAARVAVIAEGVSNSEIHRTTVRGILGVVSDSPMTIDDSLILVDPGSMSIGLRTAADPPLIDAHNLTIVGPGSPGPLGVAAQSGDIHLRNSIVTGFATAITRDKQFNVETEYSDYAGPITVTGSTGSGTTAENNHLNVDPGFANAAAGDYSLAPGSPLINAGDPAGIAAGDSLTDLVGSPRIAGGRLDVGAFEFQPPPPVTKDTTAPTFSGVSLTNKVFTVGKGATPVSAKKKRRVKVGTSFRFTLSEAATVKLVIAQKLPGRRAGKVCRKTSRKNRGRKRCTRFVKKGTLTRAGAAGANSVKFTGRIGRRALKPGSYRVSITATDAAGNRSKPKTLSFRVVRPARGS